MDEGLRDTGYIEKTVWLYKRTRQILLKTEEFFADEFGTFMQPKLEFSYAFDHMVLFLSLEPADEEKCEKVAYDVYKHVHRAFFETADWVCRKVKKSIDKEMGRYSFDTIRAAIPNYYSEIRLDVMKVSKQVALYREQKSLLFEDEVIIGYVELVYKLFEHYEQIVIAKESLIELHKKEKRRQLFPWLIALLSLAVAIASLLL